MTPGFWRRLAVRGCLGLLLATPVVVVADDDLDVTMRMVRDNDDLTESVVREIELREPVALERRNGDAGKPADTTGAARGVEKAREARDRGREAARTATERAKEVRERNEQRERPDRPEPPGASRRPEKPELP
ncbi:hypothetical protein [Marinobacter sp. SS13-12]|uniref:hypothetical protein n=1 Tax=Marinobacter sp. SS13-12 TaxID=3050451 RepID=UPI002555042A|nr:hypothetical protein [Marinobacter sp. SS13-12]MDK8465498.1 hypothetical protein [Marinobacter sp. SS13-12]